MLNESRVNPAVQNFQLDRVFGIRQSDRKSRQSWERVEFLCSHETSAPCCDRSFSVRVAQLVVSVLISTLTSHAGPGSYQSQTHLPSQRAQQTCDTCLTLQPPPQPPQVVFCPKGDHRCELLSCTKTLAVAPWSVTSLATVRARPAVGDHGMRG